MTDPRELGLPPAGMAPFFGPSHAAMESAVRRHQHRRRTRTAFTGAAAVAVAAALFASQLGDGSTAVLEQDQPAVRPAPQSTAAPSAVTDGLVVPPAPVDLATGDRPPGRRPTVVVPPAAPTRHYDATRWKRSVVAPDWQCGATSVSEWTPTGWCLDATLPTNIRSGHRTRLDVRVCRTGVDRAELRFPSGQQAAVELFDNRHGHILWRSSDRPSPFTAGERVLLTPGHCLQWTTVWDVRAGGRSIAAGTYQYRWTTGTGLTTPTGTGDHQVKAVKVAG